MKAEKLESKSSKSDIEIHKSVVTPIEWMTSISNAKLLEPVDSENIISTEHIDIQSYWKKGVKLS